jgi:hypothetical protein
VKLRIAGVLTAFLVLLGGIVGAAPASAAQAPASADVASVAVRTALLSSSYPPPWQIRLHQFSWFSDPPSTYDINILQYLAPDGQQTYCINIGGNWNNIVQAVTMNAPGVLHVYPYWGCEQSSSWEVATASCLSSSMCLQQKTCDYWSWGAWRYGPWSTGASNCAISEGQPSSIRWKRWN